MKSNYINTWVRYLIVFVLFIAKSTVATAANWISLENAQVASEVRTYIDLSSIAYKDGYMMAWMKHEYSSDQPIKNTDKTYRTELRHRVFKCAEREFATETLVWYEGQQGFSPLVGNSTGFSGKWVFKPIVPDTAGADWIDYVCKFFPKKKR